MRHHNTIVDVPESVKPDPDHVTAPRQSSDGANPARLEDQLFVALLSGDDEESTRAWNALFAAAKRFAEMLGARDNRVVGSQTADDVASEAAWRLATAVWNRRVDATNLYSYLWRTVRSIVIDRHRRQAARLEQAAGDGASVEDSLPDPAAHHEQALIDRDERRAAAERIRRAVGAWCEWLEIMCELCGKRPALRRMLALMEEYLRTELTSAQSIPGEAAPRTLKQLVKTADLARLTLSLTALNAFLRSHGESRNAVDLAWKYLKQTAGAHGVAMPPGLSTKRAPGSAWLRQIRSLPSVVRPAETA